MKNHSGCKRGFVQVSRAWYGPANLKDNAIKDIVTIGFYYPDGGTSGEFEVVWRRVGKKTIPRLVASDGSWNALYHCRDLLKVMAELDGKNISPGDLSNFLVLLGFEDMTPEKRE